MKDELIAELEKQVNIISEYALERDKPDFEAGAIALAAALMEWAKGNLEAAPKQGDGN